LGMLTALHLGVDLIARHHGVTVDLATIPQEPEVYDMLCKADSIGVFQVESRAQMATLPRLKPRHFYDLVVEVALIRPGPIQGGSVHPYIRRRNGQEPVTYLHPLLEKSLEKTLGVPLFQEQLMQMAIDVAGFSAGEADQLRQAMGSKRSTERMEALRGRLYQGMAANGITGATADAIYDKLAAFANFGFPESHSVSFAYLVYSSSWMKLHFPAAFCAALLNAQPMGFYSPNTLVADARRHGVEVHGPDVNQSEAKATLEPAPSPPRTGDTFRDIAPESVTSSSGEGGGGAGVRLGIESVRAVGDELAARIAASRPYVSMEDFVRRTRASLPAIEALATAGAFGSLDASGSGGQKLSRRESLWGAGAVAQGSEKNLDGIVCGADAPELPKMTEIEETAADLWATGISPARHPAQFARPRLDKMGAVTAAALSSLPHGKRVTVGGIVTHRQRPATAGGTIFVNLEDETGMLNVICSAGVWARYRKVARSSSALLVRGRLEKADDAINLVADKIETLALSVSTKARDFR
ncbi:MAG TPA: OB-fold nucleic acid binding domain-containing protein, partial [Acidimicrobiales bacterium]